MKLKDKKYKIIPQLKGLNNEELERKLNKYKIAKVKSLSFNEWFWLHPSSYQLLLYGRHLISVTLFGTLTIIVNPVPLKILTGFLAAYNLYKLYHHYKIRSVYYDRTNYEEQMK